MKMFKDVNKIIRRLSKREQVINYKYREYLSELELVYSYDKVGVFPVFDVFVNNCRNPFGFEYGSNSNHYFIRQLFEFESEVAYEQSYLNKFYQLWQPRTVGDVFGLSHQSMSKYLNKELVDGFILPWQCDPSILKSAAGWQYSGPVSYSMGVEHFNRLNRVYASIVKYGYRPEENINNSDMHIKGYFLKRRDDFRFLVVNGTHRMAVLSFLCMNKNYSDRIPVTFRINNPRVIDVANVSEWPQVRYGNISSTDASFIFDKIFDGNHIDIWGSYEEEMGGCKA